MNSFESLLAPVRLAQIFCALFFAILFLQSGLDKVVDWKGNLGWLTSHFAKSPLASVVPLLLAVITVLELSAGVVSAWGALRLLLNQGPQVASYGAALAAVSLLSLFLGQRLAKDYAGAGGLVPYFLVALASLFILR